MKKKGSFLNILIKRGVSSDADRVSGLPLSKKVTIYSDLYGIPHVYAENDRDLMTALGYLHARDRLWQLESMRRFASGTLAEIAGPSMVDTDHFCRLAGFQDLHLRAVKHLDDNNQLLYQSYINGINGYIELCGKNLPLEFTTLNLVPEPFTVENAGGALPLNAWYLQTNYLEEIIALAAKDTMTAEVWNSLFPSSPGEDLPEEDFFDEYRSVKVGKLIPAALGFYKSSSFAVGNSNIWVHGDGKDGAPLLANDPHLGLTVPQVWYFCHLHAPGINVCGGSMPGMPGILIGRTEQIAWGMTNVMTDCCDLYMLTVDPEHPTRYKSGRKELTMAEEKSRINILGGGHKDIIIFRSKHGPVITELKKGIEAAAALKWYGTLEEGDLEDTTFQGIFMINRSASKKEFLNAAEQIASVGQNIVYADTEQNIGWYATGRYPKRRGYSGRVPADGSSGKCDWKGFHPAKRNPSIENPKSKIIVNANNKSVKGSLSRRITHSWAAPYRHDRITQLLSELPQPGPRDFNSLQLDVFSKRAELIVPVLSGFTFDHPDAVLAQDILKNWDLYSTAESAGALIFHVFRNEFCKELLSGHLKGFLPVYLTSMDIFYTGTDHLLISYPEHKGSSPLIPKGGNLQSICEESMVRTISFIKKTQGKNPEKWMWGNLHTYHYQHPGGKGGISSWILNRGPYPAPGGTDSVNLGFFSPVNPADTPEKQYEVIAVPSLRTVISLSGLDENYFIGPLGQCGMPGHSHYDDMIEAWMENRQTQIPLTKEGVDKVSIHTQILEAAD